MRFKAIALLAGAMFTVACGGDTRTDTPAGETGTTAQAPATGTAVGDEAAAPATGTTHEVRMVVNARGEYRYEPQDITVRAGDAVRWLMVSGGPHNVHFQRDQIPQGAEGQLSANMPDKQGDLMSPMFMNEGESYTVSFANLPAGTYHYVCDPHLALGMVGNVIVQQ
jgi:plastocyanin